jgi:hypothetical protein
VTTFNHVFSHDSDHQEKYWICNRIHQAACIAPQSCQLPSTNSFELSTFEKGILFVEKGGKSTTMELLSWKNVIKEPFPEYCNCNKN